MLPRWAYHAVNPLGSSMITLAIWLSGGGMSGTAIAMLYAIMPMHGFSFYRTRTAAWLMLFLSVQTLPLCWPLDLLPPEIVVAGTLINIMTALAMTSLMGALSCSEYDAVTGLPNRRGFDLALDRSLEQAQRSGNPLSVGYLDLDRFREINEIHGRGHGDQVLLSVGRLWHRLLPPGAMLAHNGGGTFLILLPDLDVEAAARAVESLRSAPLPDGVTASACIDRWQPGETASSLLSRADASLYRAKQAGRNQLDPRSSRARPCARCGRAAHRGEFVVLYQPIVELAGQQVVAAEALVRWDHPTQGRVGPDEFSPLAEQSGLIVQLSLQALDDASRAVAIAEREGRRLGRISVNVAGRQLQQPDFARDVLAVLDAAGLQPTRLILEVTESTLGDDHRALAVRTLEELRREGIQVASTTSGRLLLAQPAHRAPGGHPEDRQGVRRGHRQGCRRVDRRRGDPAGRGAPPAHGRRGHRDPRAGDRRGRVRLPPRAGLAVRAAGAAGRSRAGPPSPWRRPRPRRGGSGGRSGVTGHHKPFLPADRRPRNTSGSHRCHHGRTVPPDLVGRRSRPLPRDGRPPCPRLADFLDAPLR